MQAASRLLTIVLTALVSYVQEKLSLAATCASSRVARVASNSISDLVVSFAWVT